MKSPFSIPPIDLPDVSTQVFHRTARQWAIEDRKVELLGQIPMDLAISRGIDKGHPLIQAEPDSVQARSFLDIATKLVTRLNELKI